MTDQSPSQISQLLERWSHGDAEALDELTPLVYPELKRLAHRYMRRERRAHTLQTSALINEVYLRFIDQHEIHWHNRTHFFCVAARLMRRILTDYARSKEYAKRRVDGLQLSLDPALLVAEKQAADVIALDDALSDLDAVDPRKSRIVEMRFFGGLTIDETAAALGVSTSTVEREWRSTRAWLHQAMKREPRHET